MQKNYPLLNTNNPNNHFKMTPLKVYCEHGAIKKPAIYELQKNGKINLVLFPYENTVKKIKDLGVPSNTSWKDMKNISWIEAPENWEDYTGSQKISKILEIIGTDPKKRKDVLHIDSAFKSNCHVFFTRDIDDIRSKKGLLEDALEMKIFNPDHDWQEFCELLKESTNCEGY